MHARNEKHELEESFRRLDREIADGYNISARTACELRIAELVAKNQKVRAHSQTSHDGVTKVVVFVTVVGSAG